MVSGHNLRRPHRRRHPHRDRRLHRLHGGAAQGPANERGQRPHRHPLLRHGQPPHRQNLHRHQGGERQRQGPRLLLQNQLRPELPRRESGVPERRPVRGPQEQLHGAVLPGGVVADSADAGGGGEGGGRVEGQQRDVRAERELAHAVERVGDRFCQVLVAP